jgi:predicted nucleic acid-binding protein
VPSVYVETSIISYLAGRPSRDLIVAARQELTHTWWRERRPAFDLYVSQVVLDEVRAGDPDAADRRAALVAGIPVLDITPEIAELAGALIQRGPLPPRAGADAAHIAAAASPSRFPADVEFDTYRERRAASARRADLPRERLSCACPVPPGPTHGRER